MKKRKRGFTLMELVVTMGIVFGLIGIIMPALNAVKNNGREARTSAEINQLDTSLLSFFSDNGHFPQSPQLLASLNSNYFNFEQVRVSGDIYKDLWNKPYIYINPAVISTKGYDLFSLGLLMSQKNAGVLERIVNALSPSIFGQATDNNLPEGQISGIAGKQVWNLPEPVYNDLVKAMLSLLRSTDVGYELAVMINIANVPIEFADLSATGAVASYNPDSHEILVDIFYALYGPIEVVTAFLAHEATHLADHLASGDMDFDSVEEEFDAFYNGAMVWKELTEGKEFENLSDFSQSAVDGEDFWLEVMESGEETAKEWMRLLYPHLPEEDQWGDSYVVAKEN